MSSVIDHEVQGLVEEKASLLLDVAQDLFKRIEDSTYTPATVPNWYTITFKFMSLPVTISLWRDVNTNKYGCTAHCMGEQVGGYSAWFDQAVNSGKTADELAARITVLVFHGMREKYVLDKLLKAIPGSIGLFGRIMVKPSGATHELYANIKYFTQDAKLCNPPETSIVPYYAELSITQGYALGENAVAEVVVLASQPHFMEVVEEWIKKHLFKLPTTSAPTPEDFE